MSIPLTVNGTTYNYPEPGESKGWGEDATAFAEGVTELLSDLKGPNDIVQTTFSLANNQTSPADITGLAFDITQVRSSVINYSIYRVTDSNELAESGQIFIVYKNNAATWSLARQFFNDDSGITFSITNTGQVQYTSTNVAGTNYSGIINFRASCLNQ